MMRQSQRTRLGKRQRIEVVGEVVEVVPEAEDEVALEDVVGEEGEDSRRSKRRDL